MKGWQIFIHSVRLVLNNLGAALRVSLVLYLATVAYHVSLFLNPPPVVSLDDPEAWQSFDTGTMMSQALLGFLMVIAGLWIAVAWHRYVLAGETPRGWLPRFHGGFILGYLGRSILIGLLIVAAAIIVSIPLGFMTLAVPILGALLPVIMVGVGAIIFFRLGVILPAGAVGRKMKLGEAWEATGNENATVLVLAGLMMAGSLILQLPSLVNGDPGSVINLVYGVVVNWFATMIGVSVLTTLYGHFVEKRPID